MYRLINQYAGAIVASIPSAHVQDYDWLLQNIAAVGTPEYQSKYRTFGAMNAAQLSPDFYTVYFAVLDEAAIHAPSLDSLSGTIHSASTRRNGGKSLQFSFATKLLHMINPHSPIYDSKVAKFYFYVAPPSDRDLEERIACFIAFHTFLVQEYARILDSGLLATAIQTFRQELNTQQFTDEKCIDSLLWAFVTLLEKGALQASQIAYR